MAASDQINSESGINNQQIQQLKNLLQISKDRFFTQLENNLEQYVNDRSAAYNFILKELNSYDGKSTFKFYQLELIWNWLLILVFFRWRVGYHESDFVEIR